ncbi:MAG: TonB-dependent receptor [Acidobacteriaceae bacterium]|nr:TonB-dependent receptor [Acidobacteriaceae bacterium]
MSVRFFVRFAFAIFLTAPFLRAQNTAQITGTITDPSGAVVGSASVVVVNESTGIESTAKSNASGIYSVPLLQPGSYRIKIQAPGFRTIQRSGVTLVVAQTALLDFKLELGTSSQSIAVTDTAPLLDASSSAIGGVVTPEKVEDLPMLGRNSNALMTLVPGVRATRATTVNPVLESHYQFFSINGSRPNQSQFMLDGGNNTNLTFNGPEYSPQVEEVQEFRIQTSNFSAEYANSGGGVINVASKSGTNQFHGSLFEYFRNDVLSANDFFSNQSGKPRPMLRYNQFGGTIGGPIIKNRTFFFFAYEGLREEVPTVVVTSVPTALQRTGDFSQTLASNGQLVQIYDPTTTRPDPLHAGAYIRTPFAGNVIPASRLDPVAQKMTSYYPAPNSAGNPYTQLNNYFFSGPSTRYTDNFSGRVDHQISDNTMLTARFSRADLSNWTNPATFGSSNIASPGYVTKPQHHPYALGRLTKTFSPTLFGEFVFSWARWYYESFGLSNGFDPTKLGFPSSLAANSLALGFPSVSPGEMSGLGGYYNEHDVSDRYEGKANISKILGKHTLKFGGMYGMGKYTTRVFDNSTGSYTFTTAFTQGPNPFVSSPNAGFGFASFLLGAMATGTQNVTDINGDYHAPYYGAYIQDDYKVTSRLTLNLGLRWEFESPRIEAQNRVSNFNYTGTATLPNGVPVKGGLLFPGVGGISRDNWNPNWKNFAPRFGFAYELNNATILRGGYGIFYSNSWGNGRNNNAMPQLGFVCSTPSPATLDNGLTPYATLSNPYPSGFCTATGNSAGLLTNLGQTLYVLDRNAPQPYVQTWNFDVQRSLPGDTVVEAAYSGSRGVHLMGILEWDQLNPAYLPLGSKLNSSVPNPFYGVITQGSLAASTITLGQSLLPYPQFLGVSDRNANYGESSYNALLVRAERRLSKGFSILVAYTLSKEIDDLVPSVNGFPGESFAGGALQNYYNLHNERALSSWDTPQTLVISYAYELPFGVGKPFLNGGGLLDKFVGGWQLNGNTTFQSGPPLQITGGNSSGTLAGTQRPNWNGQNPTLSGSVTDRLLRYFNTSDFSFNAPFTFGNAPRLMPDLRGPGINNFDISIFKNTHVTERFQLQFRAESFNAFNRVQFGIPNTNINSTAFGVISSQQNTPRNIQLGLRLLF